MTIKHKDLSRYFLQSDDWADFQRELGHNVVTESGKGWQYSAIVERGYGRVGGMFTRLYCPYGPFYTDTKSRQAAFASLDKLAKDNKLDYIRVEPIAANGDLYDGYGGYNKCARTSQPDLTLIIDLTKPFDDLLQDMTKTNRYLWHKVDRANLSFKIYYDISKLDDFLAMMHQTSQRTKAKFHNDLYYKKLFKVLGPKKSAGVAYVYHGGKPLSGVLFIDDLAAKTRYYMYAASFDEARKFSANSPLVTYLLKQAKDAGIERFDFFGLAPADQPNHRWAGFSQFKRSFGGQELQFSGTWEKPVRKLRYKTMNMIRKLA